MEKRNWIAIAGAVLAAGSLVSAPALAGTSVYMQIGTPATYDYQPAPTHYYAPQVQYNSGYHYAPQVQYGSGYHYAPQVQYSSGHHYAPQHRGHGRRDSDGDGIANRFDRDRDNDGVPNRFDRRPNNPYRY